jgi:hypothetical protein
MPMNSKTRYKSFDSDELCIQTWTQRKALDEHKLMGLKTL